MNMIMTLQASCSWKVSCLRLEIIKNTVKMVKYLNHNKTHIESFKVNYRTSCFFPSVNAGMYATTATSPWHTRNTSLPSQLQCCHRAHLMARRHSSREEELVWERAWHCVCLNLAPEWPFQAGELPKLPILFKSMKNYFVLIVISDKFLYFK